MQMISGKGLLQLGLYEIKKIIGSLPPAAVTGLITVLTQYTTDLSTPSSVAIAIASTVAIWFLKQLLSDNTDKKTPA